MRRLFSNWFVLSLLALVVIVGALFVPSLVLAQDTGTAIQLPDPATIVGYVCGHQQFLVLLVTALTGHTGFSFLSAFLKKQGITQETVDSPVAKQVIGIIRILAVDLKPTTEAILAQAAAVKPADAPQAKS